MAYSVYIGDIDPNNNIDSVTAIRRKLLYKLLLWDNIVLSDSQLLTDPRIFAMMSGFRHTPEKVSYEWQDAKEWQTGFELLLASNLIEIAQRTDIDGRESSMVSLWKNMNSKNNGNVPYLPRTSSFAKYLDRCSYRKREYSLDRIGQRFKNNLCSGIESGALVLSTSDDTDKEILRIINGNNVLFRDIFQVIRDRLNGGFITQERYDEIYTFVYSCYHTNVPAEIGCYVYTDADNLPLHLDLGTDVEGISHEIDPGRIRPTWALDPTIIDLLPVEAFLKVREVIRPCLESEKLMRYNTGVLQPEELNEYYDVWEEYTRALEEEFKRQLWQIEDEIDLIMGKQYVTTQQRQKKITIELVVSGIKVVNPFGIGTGIEIGEKVIGGVEKIKEIKECIEPFIMLNQRKNMECLPEYKKEIKAFTRRLTNGAKIITCYKQQ